MDIADQLSQGHAPLPKRIIFGKVGFANEAEFADSNKTVVPKVVGRPDIKIFDALVNLLQDRILWRNFCGAAPLSRAIKEDGKGRRRFNELNKVM